MSHFMIINQQQWQYYTLKVSCKGYRWSYRKYTAVAIHMQFKFKIELQGASTHRSYIGFILDFQFEGKL